MRLWRIRCVFMKTRILYNAECPICNAEICHYQRYTQRHGIAFGFDDLNSSDPAPYGVDADAAARRLHVLHDGAVLSGMAAFRVIWDQMPRARWLARITGAPIVRPVSDAVYDYILAPLLYATHKRRQRRQQRRGA